MLSSTPPFLQIITLPIAFLGYALFPGLPSSKKPWFLSQEEHKFASERLGEDHNTSAGKINFALVKRTAKLPCEWLRVARKT